MKNYKQRIEEAVDQIIVETPGLNTIRAYDLKYDVETITNYLKRGKIIENDQVVVGSKQQLSSIITDSFTTEEGFYVNDGTDLIPSVENGPFMFVWPYDDTYGYLATLEHAVAIAADHLPDNEDWR